MYAEPLLPPSPHTARQVSIIACTTSPTVFSYQFEIIPAPGAPGDVIWPFCADVP